MTRRRGIWPGSAVLPEKIVHSNQGVYPGQFAGLLGSRHEPWFIETTDKPHAYHAYSGAFPKYLFNLHKGQLSDRDDWRFEVANLALPEGVLEPRRRERGPRGGRRRGSPTSRNRPIGGEGLLRPSRDGR